MVSLPEKGARRRFAKMPRGACPPVLRRGLAPLELVLALPILLLVMALMVNLGTMAVWRIRGEVVARDAAWRTRWPRTGDNEPRPPRRVWPNNATMRVADANHVSQIPELNMPAIDLPVAHGPLPNGFGVTNHLKQDRGAYNGVAEINRRFPLLPNFRRFVGDPEPGTYKSGEIKHFLLGKRWSVAELRIPANVYRRTIRLYLFPKTDPRLPEAFLRAVMDILEMARFHALSVLDRDYDFWKYRRSHPDFHPHVSGRFCSTNRDQVKAARIDRLIDILQTTPSGDEVRLGVISHLPRTMTDRFLSMYRQKIAEQEQRIKRLKEERKTLPAEIAKLPPHDPNRRKMEARLAHIPGWIADAKAIIAEIRPKVAQLESYSTRLDGIEQTLKTKFRATLPPTAPTP